MKKWLGIALTNFPYVAAIIAGWYIASHIGPLYGSIVVVILILIIVVANWKR
jgi:hypothetical protein